MKRLLKFEAEWCGPCHIIRPVVEQIANEFDLELEVVNIDENPDLAESYGVKSIPTLLLVEDAVELSRHVGAAPKSIIQANLGL